MTISSSLFRRGYHCVSFYLSVCQSIRLPVSVCVCHSVFLCQCLSVLRVALKGSSTTSVTCAQLYNGRNQTRSQPNPTPCGRDPPQTCAQTTSCKSVHGGNSKQKTSKSIKLRQPRAAGIALAGQNSCKRGSEGRWHLMRKLGLLSGLCKTGVARFKMM